jgi:hypothetical protein
MNLPYNNTSDIKYLDCQVYRYDWKQNYNIKYILDESLNGIDDIIKIIYNIVFYYHGWHEFLLPVT